MGKKIMSFTELKELGYSRKDLKKYCMEKDFPGYKSAGGGKWWVYVDELPVFVKKYNKRKNAITDSIRQGIEGKLISGLM